MQVFLKRKSFFLFICLALFFLFSSVNLTKDALAEENVYTNTNLPIIHSRSTWEKDGRLRNLLKIETKQENDKENTMPRYYSPNRFILYGDACQLNLPDGSRNLNCNSYDQDPVAVIQSIYQYHVLNKGYRDIGYNFIISWDGRIFEGLYGGNGATGNHAYDDKKCRDYSLDSIGILLLANLKEGGPSKEMLQSLERLVAWLAMANDIDLDKFTESVSLWQNEKKQDSLKNYFCQKSLGQTLTIKNRTPVINCYEDAYNSNNCSIDLDNLRKRSSRLVDEFDNFLYKEEENSSLWQINNGNRSSGAVFGSRVATINSGQLEYFPLKDIKNIKEGDIIRLRDREKIYLFQDDSLHEILSMQILTEHNLNWLNIQDVDLCDLVNYRIGSPLCYLPGTLIKTKDDFRVFLVNEDDTLSHISSLRLFEDLGLKWEDVKTISQKEKLALTEGDPILFPTGTLIKDQEENLYIVAERTIKRIRRDSILKSLNLNSEDSIELPQEEIGLYRESTPLKYPDNTLLKTYNGNYYFIAGNMRHPVINLALVSLLEDESRMKVTVLDEELMEYPLGINLAGRTPLMEFQKAIDNINYDYLLLEEALPEYRQFKTIRIGLEELSANDELIISADQGYSVFYSGSVEQKSAENLYKIKLRDITAMIRLSSQRGDIIFRVKKANEEGRGKSYRGALEIAIERNDGSPDRYWLVNELFIPEYLESLTVEGKIDEVTELYKAIMVANRSLAYHYAESGGRYGEKPFDIMKNEGNLVYEPQLTKNIKNNKLLLSTRGEIVVYNDQPARTIYSSDSCGISKDARVVLGSFYNSFPYLWGGIYDPPGTDHQEGCPDIQDHGIGMSVAGGRSLCDEGKKYSQILRYYYPGTYLNKIY